jgi:hypothetical protein
VIFDSVEADINNLGVKLKRSSPDRHEKRSERMVRTVRERMRATLGGLPYRLPGRLYNHLLNHVVASLNVVPNVHTAGRAPREIVTGEKISAAISLDQPFGTMAMFKTPMDTSADHQDHRDRSELGIIIGRDFNSRGTVLTYLISSGSIVSRHTYKVVPVIKGAIEDINAIAEAETLPDIDFLISDDPQDHSQSGTAAIPDSDLRDDVTPHPLAETEPNTYINSGYNEEPVHEEPEATELPRSAPLISAPISAASAPTETAAARTPFERGSMDVTPENIIPSSGRSRRSKARVDYSSAFHAEGEDVFNMTLRAATALRGPAAMESAALELRSMMEMDALEPVDASTLTREEYAKVLPSHLFLKEKHDANGAFVKLKSRLVGGGHRQDRSDYENLSSPTVRTQSVFLALNEAAMEKRAVSTIDIKGAYLNAKLKSVNVYIRLTKDLAKIYSTLNPKYKKYLRKDGSMILKVNKALYGLIEAAMLWYEHIKATLLRLGYLCLNADQGIFKRATPLGRSTVCIHVDDLLVTTTHPSLDTHLREGLKKTYQGITIHEGLNQSYLGMSIDIDHANKCIRVSQPGYIADVLREHGVTKPFKSPCTANLLVPTVNAKSIDIAPHRSKVMQLSYLSGRTRPDIAFTVSHLVTRLNNPTTDDEFAVQRLLGYILHTKDLKLTFAPTSMTLYCFADASYAIHPDAKSHMGITMQIGERNAPFHNKSGIIKAVCRSSTEAEIAALNELISDVLHTRDLLEELGHKQPTTTVYEDNTAAIQLLEGPITNYQTRSKHIKVRYAFFKQQLDLAHVSFTHCPTDKMLADIHTKPLTGEKFLIPRDELLGIYKDSNRTSRVC